MDVSRVTLMDIQLDYVTAPPKDNQMENLMGGLLGNLKDNLRVLHLLDY